MGAVERGGEAVGAVCRGPGGRCDPFSGEDARVDVAAVVCAWFGVVEGGGDGVGGRGRAGAVGESPELELEPVGHAAQVWIAGSGGDPNHDVVAAAEPLA